MSVPGVVVAVAGLAIAAVPAAAQGVRIVYPPPRPAIPASGPVRFESGSRLNHLAFVGDGRTLATVGQEGKLYLWTTATGAKLGEATVQPANNVCHWDVFALPTAGQVLAAGTLGTAYVLDTGSGRVLRQFKTPERSQGFALLDGGKTLLALDHKLSLTRIDPEGGRATPVELPPGPPPAPGHGGRAVLAPDGKTFVANADGFRLFAAATRRERYALKPLPGRFPAGGPGIGPAVPVYSPDARFVALQGPDATVRLVEVASGKELRVLKSEDYEASPAPGLSGGLKTLAPVALSPGGKWLAVMVGTPFYGDILVVGTASGLELRRFPSRQVSPISGGFAFSPDGRLLATPGPNGRGADLWDLESGEAWQPEGKK